MVVIIIAGFAALCAVFIVFAVTKFSRKQRELKRAIKRGKKKWDREDADKRADIHSNTFFNHLLELASKGSLENYCFNRFMLYYNFSVVQTYDHSSSNLNNYMSSKGGTNGNIVDFAKLGHDPLTAEECRVFEWQLADGISQLPNVESVTLWDEFTVKRAGSFIDEKGSHNAKKISGKYYEITYKDGKEKKYTKIAIS